MNIPDVSSLLEKYQNLVTKKEFHITLEYYNGVQLNTLSDLDFKEGIEHQITIMGYACNEKAFAFHVEIPKVCKRVNGNKNNHITFALSPQIQAKYSSELIDEAIVNDSYVKLINPVVMTAITKRFMRK